MNLPIVFCCAATLFCFSAAAEEKTQPLPKDLREVPSLNRTFEEGMDGLTERFKMKQRAALTKGIDNWFAVDESQRVALSLKCVGKTVIAGSMEVPMVTSDGDKPSTDPLMTLDKFLVNLCPHQGLDAGGQILGLAGAIEQLSKENSQVFKEERNGILIFAVSMPSRKSIQFNVISLKFLNKNYDADGL